MDNSSDSSPKLEDSPALKLTGKIIMIVMLVLFILVAFVLFLHLYTRWFWYRRGHDDTTRRRRRRSDFGAGYEETTPATILRRGLDPSVLNSIPVIVFHAEEFKEGLECSVCLSEISHGETARLLPKCNHGFHVDCIDMWFRSHSTCPICRNPISSSNPTSEEHSPETTESFSFPTNVLYWGNETEVSTMDSNSEENSQGHTCYQPQCSSSSSTSDNRTEGMLAIDIPREMVEEEEVRSPVMTRLRRLLSMDRRMVAGSPSHLDVEEQASRANK
ncbi:RING-H2 finger protein ATL3-like [Cornus florida]|uniref:RING-H2 finger protein ATL3-like n=1 Tax=Cornus florida TaxID=4283 RepID=UPI0028A24ACF|nr:RING-H2 finger protein ATL3-like [Cornus florida]